MAVMTNKFFRSLNMSVIKEHLLQYLFWYMLFISITLHSFVLFFDFSTSGPALYTNYTELSLVNVNEMRFSEQKITEVKEVSEKRDENLVEENNKRRNVNLSSQNNMLSSLWHRAICC